MTWLIFAAIAVSSVLALNAAFVLAVSWQPIADWFASQAASRHPSWPRREGGQP